MTVAQFFPMSVEYWSLIPGKQRFIQLQGCEIKSGNVLKGVQSIASALISSPYSRHKTFTVHSSG